MDLSYTYYPNGLTAARNDLVNGRQQSFSYDYSGRLTEWDLNNCGAVYCLSQPFRRQYAYDTDGNLTGTFGYNASIHLWFALQSNTYGGNQGGPHALTAQTTPSGRRTNLFYDTKGRQTSNGAGRKIVYNAFDLPRTVFEGHTAWTLLYDAFGNRVSKSGLLEGTTVYIGGIFQRRMPPPLIEAAPLDVFKIPSIGQVETNKSDNTTNTLYTLSDPLGSSIAVLQGGPSASKSLLSNFFYEPFGARIDATGSPSTAAGTAADVQEGFTGQEHDDNFGLINFKGRMRIRI